jgi:hypothetical protein
MPLNAKQPRVLLGSPVGLALFTALCCSQKHQLMRASYVRVSNLTPPGSECNP